MPGRETIKQFVREALAKRIDEKTQPTPSTDLKPVDVEVDGLDESAKDVIT